MRALLRLAIAGFLLVFGTPHLVVAHQIATPENGSPKDATQTTAAGYTLVDAEGATLADFTVIAVEDPPDDLVAGFTPAEGARPVLVTVQVENTGEGPFEVRPDLVALQDADGYLWSSTTIQRAEGFTIPDFQRVSIAPGDRVTGVLGFQVPVGSDLARVMLIPEPSRVLVLSDLATGGAAPAVGDEVTWDTPSTGAEGIVAVTDLADPFTDAPAGTTPPEGMRYVVATVSFENTGATPLDVRTGTVLLQDANGYLWNYASVPRDTDEVVPDLQGQTLAPGSKISGVVGFQVAVDSEIANIVFQPETGRLIVIASLETGV